MQFIYSIVIVLVMTEYVANRKTSELFLIVSMSSSKTKHALGAPYKDEGGGVEVSFPRRHNSSCISCGSQSSNIGFIMWVTVYNEYTLSFFVCQLNYLLPISFKNQ